ncbi:MAG: hypothetical protein M1561_07780 [Gammaproteobacteria bacterium]|nr:hypothetical protein [Gammaproteobacteria bacterium]
MRNMRGIVLITTLLFLIVLSLMVMSALEVCLFATKVGKFSTEKYQTIYLAENRLLEYQQKLLAGKDVKSAVLIDNRTCGVSFYRVFSDVKSGITKTQLQSTVVVIDNSPHCVPKPIQIPGRQSWQINW